MVVTGIELKWAPIIEGVEIFEVRKLGWDRDRLLLAGLTIKDLHFIPLGFQRSRKIGQTQGLGPNRCLVKISNRRLNEEYLHVKVARIIGFVGFAEFFGFLELSQ
jgi:hypothetical protein